MAVQLVGTDSEEEVLATVKAMPQWSSRLACRIGVLTAALGLATTVLCSVSAGRRRGQSAAPVGAHDLQWKEANIFHDSKFGSAPDSITLSGFCEVQAQFNAEFTFAGLTGEGRPWYKNQHGDKIYYDRERDGESDGADSHWGEWVALFRSNKFHPERKEKFTDHLKCSAYLIQEEDVSKTEAGRVAGQAGVAPPIEARWNSWCKEWVHQDIKVKNGDKKIPVVVNGKWVYQFHAMPDQEVKITHGKEVKTSKGNTWDARGSASVSFGAEAHGEVTGTVGVPVFGPEADATVGGSVSSEVSSEVSSGYERQWSQETKVSHTVETTFKLPSDKGQALWQWMLIAKSPTGEEGHVRTQQYAFTGGGTSLDRPRCYPGGSKDGYKYQECHKGWHIK